MDELFNIAVAHFKASPDNIQALAHNFFNAMDNDGDGKIDLHEFLAFMKEQGYTQMTNRCFFEKLDRDHNGTLDFWEVMAVYYIVKSGRPFCDHCGDFIPGTYFRCMACLKNPISKGTFDLCLDCYLSKVCDHTHEGIYQFMDNYSLLETEIRSTLNQSLSVEAKSPPFPSTSLPSSTSVPSTWNIHNTYTYTPPNSLHYPAATSNAFVPERQKWRIAFAALETAITVGAIGATVSSCTII